MSPRDLVYVGHMLDMARKAVAKVRDLPRETYDADEKDSNRCMMATGRRYHGRP